MIPEVTHTPVFSFFGVQQGENALTMDDGFSPEMENVDLHPFGTVSKRNGYEHYLLPDSDDFTPVDGLAILEKIEDEKRALYQFTRDKIYRSWVHSGGVETPVEAHSFASSNPGLQFVTATALFVETDTTNRGACLYIADGTHIPLVARGLDSSDITEMTEGLYDVSGTPGYPSSGTGEDEFREWDNYPPKGFMLRGEGTQERLYAWGFADDPNRVDYSEMGVPYNFLRKDVDITPLTDVPATDGGWFRCVNNDGDYVVGVVELYDLLVVLKRKKTVIYAGVHGTDFQIAQVLPVGCTSFKSVKKIGRDLIFWSASGPVTLRGIQEYGDIGPTLSGEMMQDLVDDIQPERMEKIVAFHDKKKFRVLWWVPADSATNDKVVCFYYDRPRWAPWTGALAEMADVVELDEGTFGAFAGYGATYGGRVVKLLSGTADGLDANGDSVAISTTIVTKWHILADVGQRVRALKFRVLADSLGLAETKVYMRWDFVTPYTELTEKLKALGAGGHAWGFGKWSEMVWTATGSGYKTWGMNKTGYIVQIKLEDESVRPFNLLGWYAEHSPKGVQ